MKDRTSLIEKLTKLSNDIACSPHERASAKNIIKKLEAESFNTEAKSFNVVKRIKTVSNQNDKK